MFHAVAVPCSIHENEASVSVEPTQANCVGLGHVGGIQVLFHEIRRPADGADAS